jgi:hypothetical protein
MKALKSIVLLFILAWAAFSAQAQGTFQNLDFEQANPVMTTDPSSPFYFYGVTVASALPGWNVDINNIPQDSIFPNALPPDLAAVSLLGPNPSGQTFGIISGNYSALVESGFLTGTTTGVSASIWQLGVIPATTQSMEFKAWPLSPTDFTVSFNGNILTPIALGSGPNYTLYGVNIAPYAGELGGLRFTVPFAAPSGNELGLDDIAFSPNSVVPEPSILALGAIGGLLFGARKLLARER